MKKAICFEKASEYLECEKWCVFTTMMFVGGYYGAFTYSIRGGIFCNAQTANFVLFAMALGKGEWSHAMYYLLPMSAYFLGAFISEWASVSFLRIHFIRWDTCLIFLEMILVVVLGFIPETAPFQISQILVNFICSMQYNTFRQAQGIPMATTFCTNHLRQTGIACYKALCSRSREDVGRLLSHVFMLVVFVLGCVISTVLCRRFLGRAIWGALIPLSFVLADLLHADFRTEKEKLDQAPQGH